MEGTKTATAITVEPPSEEDVAARLKVPTNEGDSGLQCAGQGITLQVQIKSRSSAWTDAPLREVFYGPRLNEAEKKKKAPTAKPRQQAVDLVGTSTTLYVLLTDAQVPTEYRGFCVDTVGDSSTATDLPEPPPGRTKPADSASRAPRITIIQQRQREALEEFTRKLLREKLNVPQGRLEDCLVALHHQIHLRLLRDESPSLSRGQLTALAQRFDGSPGASPLMARHVAPREMQNFRELLESRYALFIYGPPGTGKSLAGEMLGHEHRVRTDPFDVVNARTPCDAAAALSRAAPGPVLVIADDPLGPARADHEVQDWTSQLPKLLRLVGATRRLLVVSRTANLDAAVKNVSSFRPLAVQLGLDSYSRDDRWRIVQNELKDKLPWHSDFVHQNKHRILDALPTPFSLSTFCRQLGDLEKEVDASCERLLRSSQIESISESVRQCVEHASQVEAGVVLWGLIVSELGIDDVLLRNTFGALKAGERQLETRTSERIDLLKLVKTLEAQGWVRRTAADPITHPIVVEGLETLLASHPQSAEDALEALLAGWLARGDYAQTLRLVDQCLRKKIALPESVLEPIAAAALAKASNQDHGDFRGAFARVLALGMKSPPGALLASLLNELARNAAKFMSPFSVWAEPVLTAEQRSAITQSPEAVRIAEGFVREVLPREHHDYRHLPKFLRETLGWNLTNAFVEGLTEAMYQDGDPRVFVRGALEGADPDFDRVLSVISAAITDVCNWYESEAAKHHQAAQQELDAAEIDHLAEAPGERMYPIRRALEEYVSLRRKAQGHAWIPLGPFTSDDDRSMRIAAWSKAIAADTTPVRDDELKALAAACPPDDPRELWRAGATSPIVINSVVTAPAHHVVEGLRLLEQHKQESSKQALLELRKNRSLEDRAEIVMGLQPRSPSLEPAVNPSALLDEHEVTAVALCTDPRTEILAPAVLGALRHLARRLPRRLGIGAIEALKALGQEHSDLLEGILESVEPTERVRALRLSDRASVLKALHDPHYECRALAVEILSNGASQEEWEQIRELVTDASAPVRKAVAEAIGKEKWRDGINSLIQLLGDDRDWNLGPYSMEAGPEFEVARAAAASLLLLGDLSSAQIDSITAFIRAGRKSTRDIEVHLSLVALIEQAEQPGVLRLLEALLASQWRMHNRREVWYPLRRKAAWALVGRIESDVGGAKREVTLESLEVAANHSDDELAAPALVGLGLVGDRGVASARRALLSRQTSTARCLAYCACFVLGSGKLPPDDVIDPVRQHALMKLLNARISVGRVPPDVMSEWLKSDAASKLMKAEDPVSRTLVEALDRL